MSKGLQRERTTLSEVATRAGVSMSTVSLVLAGKSEQRRIGQETRDRVRRAAEDLNYAPNLLTRSLRRGRTHVLSFYSSFRNRRRGDLYMDRISAAIEIAGGEFGYDVLVHCNFGRSQQETYQFLNGGMSDGLIMLSPVPGDPLLEILRRSALPVVIINGQDPKHQYASSSDDVEQGMAAVAEQLVRHGHTRIAALGQVHEYVRDSEQRLQLLSDNLALHGVSVACQRLGTAPGEIERVLEDLMSQPNPPTAIFCWNDLLAYRVLEVCESKGIRVPEQLSIIGYDGIHWPSTSKHICTSVEVDLDAIARTAVRLLDQSITDSSVMGHHQVVPVGFRMGSTLMAVPQKNATEQL